MWQIVNKLRILIRILIRLDVSFSRQRTHILVWRILPWLAMFCRRDGGKSVKAFVGVGAGTKLYAN